MTLDTGEREIFVLYPGDKAHNRDVVMLSVENVNCCL